MTNKYLFFFHQEEGISFNTLKDDSIKETEEETPVLSENNSEQAESMEVQSEPLINITDTIISLEDEAEKTKMEGAEEELPEEDPLELLARSRIEQTNKDKKIETKEGDDKMIEEKQHAEVEDNFFDQLEKENLNIETLVSEENQDTSATTIDAS